MTLCREGACRGDMATLTGTGICHRQGVLGWGVVQGYKPVLWGPPTSSQTIWNWNEPLYLSVLQDLRGSLGGF